MLNKHEIPVSHVSIGPVSKNNITRMLDHDNKKKEYSCILAFDVKIFPDALKHADDNKIKIFTADIIYHLFDLFVKYSKEC